MGGYCINVTLVLAFLFHMTNAQASLVSCNFLCDDGSSVNAQSIMRQNARPPGKAGPVGPKGSQGDLGIQGMKGVKGEAGHVGIKGRQGLQGHKGSKGEVGELSRSSITTLQEDIEEIKQYLKWLKKGYQQASNGFFYKLYTSELVNYDAAKALCREDNARLASTGLQEANSRQEIRTTFAEPSGANIWVGLSDYPVRHTWVWSDGTRSTLQNTDWKTGEPNGYNGKEERCAHMYSRYSWKLNDARCDYEYFALCESPSAALPGMMKL